MLLVFAIETNGLVTILFPNWKHRALCILDAYAQNGAVYQEYYAVYRELIKVKKELDAIITDEGEKQRKIDLLSYQVQEIEDASLTAGEEETLAGGTGDVLYARKQCGKIRCRCDPAYGGNRL